MKEEKNKYMIRYRFLLFDLAVAPAADVRELFLGFKIAPGGDGGSGEEEITDDADSLDDRRGWIGCSLLSSWLLARDLPLRTGRFTTGGGRGGTSSSSSSSSINAPGSRRLVLLVGYTCACELRVFRD